MTEADWSKGTRLDYKYLFEYEELMKKHDALVIELQRTRNRLTWLNKKLNNQGMNDLLKEMEEVDL